MNLTIAVCDDEKMIADEIREKCLQHRPEYTVDIYQSGEELLDSAGDYDIIFLDIEMPGMNGMEVATELRKREYDGNMVFLTSHTEFMPDAFKVKAFRFLHKPVNTADFKEALGEAEKEILNHKKILVHTAEGEKVLNIRDIIYFETVRNYTYIHTGQGEIETRKTLRECLELVGSEHFCQVHKSYVIAFRYIEAVGDDGVVMGTVHAKIPVSRRRSREVREAFFSYVKKYAMYTYT